MQLSFYYRTTAKVLANNMTLSSGVNYSVGAGMGRRMRVRRGVNNAQVPTVMPRLDLATRTVSASATSQPARYLAARVRM